MSEYRVYMLSNASRTLCIGITNDLARRLQQHRSKGVPGFTRDYNVTLLVYVESYPDAREAIAREKQLTGWARAKEVRLIEARNPGWRDLSGDIE